MKPSNITCDDFRAWRKRMKWTRRHAANRLGLSYSSVQNYESGKRADKDQIQIPVIVALGLAALENKLKPLGDYPVIQPRGE